MTVIGHMLKDPLITRFRMSDRIQNKIDELGITWEEITPDIIEFLDNKYRSPDDGIIIEDNENPKISKKMRFFQTNDGLALMRIRMNRMNRLADNDKIRFKVIIGDAIPDVIKVKIAFKDKPMKQVKICKVKLKFLKNTIIRIKFRDMELSGGHQNSLYLKTNGVMKQDTKMFGVVTWQSLKNWP